VDETGNLKQANLEVAEASSSFAQRLSSIMVVRDHQQHGTIQERTVSDAADLEGVVRPDVQHDHVQLRLLLNSTENRDT
jgi:hypothetical protein